MGARRVGQARAAIGFAIASLLVVVRASATPPAPPLELALRLESGTLHWSLMAHADLEVRRTDWRLAPDASWTPPFRSLALRAGESRHGSTLLPGRRVTWIEARLELATFAGAMTLGAAARAGDPTPRRVQVNAKPRHSAPAAGAVLTATLLYEDRLLDARGYSGAVQLLPLRHVAVDLLDAMTGDLLGRGRSDAAGQVQLEGPTPTGNLALLRLASTTRGDPRYALAVLDPPGTGPDALLRAAPHHVETETFALAAGGVDLGTIVLRDPDGFGHVQAFHILDVAIDAWDALRSGTFVDVDPGPADSLGFLWGPALRSRSTAYGNGYIELASPGSGDTDGWSDALILHEIGHHVARRFLRDTSAGGIHLLGDVEQDLQLAWSEGLATAFACAVRNWRATARRNFDGMPADDGIALFVNVGLPPPDGVTGGLQYVWDVEAATLGGMPMPRDGSGSETSIAGILWDLMDADTTPDGRGGDDDPFPGPPARTGATLRAMRALPPALRVTFEDAVRAWLATATPDESAALASVLADFRVEYVADSFEPDASESPPALQPAMGPEAAGEVVIAEIIGGARIAVELVNRAVEPRDLGGWQLLARSNTSSGNPALTFTIPAGFLLGPGGRVVIRRGRPRDNTPREIFADLWTVPWFPGFEGALTLLDAAGRGVDFVRWSARDGTPSSTTPPEGVGWSGVVEGHGFAASLARRGGVPDGDLASDFTAGVPTLGAPNDVPNVHRTFYPERDFDVLRWVAPHDGVFTLVVHHLRSGALPRLEAWRPGGSTPIAAGEPVSRDGGDTRLSLAAHAGEVFDVRLAHAGTLTRFGAYDIALWREADAQLPLPPRGLRADVELSGIGGRVRFDWQNAAAYDSLQIRTGPGAWQRLDAAARSWEVELPLGRHTVELVAFARGVAAPAPPVLVAVEAWPDELSESFETLSTEQWQTTGTWGLDAVPGRGGRALSTRPGGSYADDSEGVVRLRGAIVPDATTWLEFDHICIVRPEDVAQIEISADWGSTWRTLARWDWNAHTGDGETADWRDGQAAPGDWVHERLALGEWAGKPVQLRFAFASDNRGTSAGWFVDELHVAPAVAPRFAVQLLPNVPNPFNPGTQIRFVLSQATSVRLRILDARGALVRTLIEVPFTAGAHAVAWDGRDFSGRNVASGIYFAELRGGPEIRAQKLVLAR